MQNDLFRVLLVFFDIVDFGEEERILRGVFQFVVEKFKINSKYGMDKFIKKYQIVTEEIVFDECDFKLRKKIGRFLSVKTYKKILEIKGEEKCYEGEKDIVSIDNSVDEVFFFGNSLDLDFDSFDLDSGYLRLGYVKVENRQLGDFNLGIYVEIFYFKYIFDFIYFNDSLCEFIFIFSLILFRVFILILLGELQNEKI